MFLEAFLAYLATPSKETLRAYEADVRRFLTYLETIGTSLETLTAFTIENYISHLNSTSRTGKPLSAASIGRRLTVISSYLDFLHVRTHGAVQNYVRDVRRPRVDNAIKRALAPSTVSALLDGIDNVRDKALIALYVASGLRLEEARQLDVTSISRRRRVMPDGSTRTLGIGEVRGKGNKVKDFLIDEQTLELILNYLRSRGKIENPALFLSNRRLRLSRRSIQDILDRWCTKLGLPHAHIHALRHTFATNAANYGMSTLVLQQILGHKSPAVTQRYTAMRPERVALEYFAVQERISH